MPTMRAHVLDISSGGGKLPIAHWKASSILQLPRFKTKPPRSLTKHYCMLNNGFFFFHLLCMIRAASCFKRKENIQIISTDRQLYHFSRTVIRHNCDDTIRSKERKSNQLKRTIVKFRSEKKSLKEKRG